MSPELSPQRINARRPLAGTKVLDLTRLLPGPFATLCLADLGASVDKLEDPAPGDYLRNFPPMVGSQGAVFACLNRDKRSVVLDLKHPEGAKAFLRLVAHYDVLVEGFRPGVLDRLGVGHAKLLEVNPRLVVCAITGYGQDSPLSQRAGHDINYLARAGVLGVTGPADGPPMVSGAQMADIAGGAQWAVSGILAALLDRERTHQGCVVDIAMCDGAVPLAAFALGGLYANESPSARGASTLDGGIAPYGTYLTQDNRSVSLGALEPKFWHTFALAVGLSPDLEALVPGPHQVSLKATLTKVFASRTRAEWQEFSLSHDCCLEPVLEPHELANDPHFRARGVFFSGHTHDGLAITCLNTPLGPGASSAHRPASTAGADTVEILTDAGFSADELNALRTAGAISG